MTYLAETNNTTVKSPFYILVANAQVCLCAYKHYLMFIFYSILTSSHEKFASQIKRTMKYQTRLTQGLSCSHTQTIELDEVFKHKTRHLTKLDSLNTHAKRWLHGHSYALGFWYASPNSFMIRTILPEHMQNTCTSLVPFSLLTGSLFATDCSYI